MIIKFSLKFTVIRHGIKCRESGIVRSELRSGAEWSILRKAGAWSGVYSRGLLAERSGVYSTKCRSGANFAPLRPFLQFLNIRNFLATIGGQKVRLKIFRPLRRPKSTPKFFGPLRRPKSTHQNFFSLPERSERSGTPLRGSERSGVYSGKKYSPERGAEYTPVAGARSGANSGKIRSVQSLLNSILWLINQPCDINTYQNHDRSTPNLT